MDRLSEVDDEVDVDVEECSDSEEASRSGQDGRRTHSRATATPNSVSDEERLTPEPASVSAKKVRGLRIYPWGASVNYVMRFGTRLLENVTNAFSL